MWRWTVPWRDRKGVSGCGRTAPRLGGAPFQVIDCGAKLFFEAGGFADEISDVPRRGHERRVYHMKGVTQHPVVHLWGRVLLWSEARPKESLAPAYVNWSTMTAVSAKVASTRPLNAHVLEERTEKTVPTASVTEKLVSAEALK